MQQAAWGQQTQAQPQQQVPQAAQTFGSGPPGQTQGGSISVDGVMREFSELNDAYYAEVTKGVNALVDSKVAVHAHDKILDDQTDEYKDKIGEIENNI